MGGSILTRLLLLQILFIGACTEDKANPPLENHEVCFPSFCFEIPGELQVASEDGGETILAHFPNTDIANLRVSSFGFTGVDKDRCVELVEKAASEKNKKTYRVGEKTVFEDEEGSKEDGVPIIVKSWLVGHKRYIAVVSLVTVWEKQDHQIAKRMKKITSEVIKSIRSNEVDRTLLDLKRLRDSGTTTIEK